MVRLRGAAMFAAVIAVGTVAPATAQGPATIRGQVYSCRTHAAVGDVRVRLRGIDDGSTTMLAVSRDGRFRRVGVMPGRYLVSVIPLELTVTDRHIPRGPVEIAPFASRLARVETDDVLDVKIGVTPTVRRNGIETVRRTTWLREVSLTPQPVCDDPVVPLAPPTSDRYIIR